MEQKELIRKFKSKNFEDIDIRSAARYFKSARVFYADLQDGKPVILTFLRERSFCMRNAKNQNANLILPQIAAADTGIPKRV